jgi:hypothetical protein
MEKIYCEHWEQRALIEGSSFDDASVLCWYKIHHDNCMYDAADIYTMMLEGVFCPFWFVNVSWIDSQLLGEILDDIKYV